MRRFFARLVILGFASFGASGCAYHFGKASRTIPGGYTKISIPVFKNKTQEVSAEVAFTRALLEEFQRSKVAQVVDDDHSEVRIQGEITSIQYLPDSRKTTRELPTLPLGTVLASQYRMLVNVEVRVIRRSDGAVLWGDGFAKDTSFAAPLVTATGVNSVNPLYNLSARRQNLETMAADMMIEAHSRITENF